MSLPERFGPYRLVRRLGRGGMAEAFEAMRDPGGEATPRVCLKRILPGLGDLTEMREGLAAEARIGAALRHGNIVALLDHGEVDGQPYIVLELVEGTDLRRLLKALAALGEPMPWPVVAELAFAMAHALDYAHGMVRDGSVAGILHRDISPSNVLLGRHGEVKLADFGIAKVIGESHATRTGLLKGKIPYMAPEYVGGAGFEARSDLFALGVTLHECLVGTRPFDGTSDVETLDRILSGARIPLAQRAIDAPRALVETVDALLAHHPDERPRSGREVATLLRDAAPPVDARSDLAMAVRSLMATTGAAPLEAAVAAESAGAPEPTWLFTRTELARGGRPAAPSEPRPAGPDERTQTRHPR